MTSRSREREGIRFQKFRHSRAPENRVRRPERAILAVINRLQGFHRKRYAFPAQRTILEYLWRWHRVKMSPRTLCRHLNALQQEIQVSRTRRLEYHRRKGTRFRSTLYHLQARYFARVKTEAIFALRSLAASSASGRVPYPANHLRSFIENLSSAAGYPQGRSPPKANRDPRARARG